MSVVWEDRSLVRNLETFDTRVEAMITAAVTYHATRAVAYARANAPWTDRTSNARNGLFAKAERDGKSHRIIIGHSVPYGVWLEVRWNGRYQILRPTIDHEGPELMKTLSAGFAAMGRGV